MKPQYPVTRSDAEWRKLLKPEQYMVMRRFGTEPAGSCALNHEKRAGTFVCAGCDQPLFVSRTKYESNTGWPSFNDPIEGAVGTKRIRSTAICKSRCTAANAEVTSDTFSPMDRHRPIGGIVSMAWQ